MAKQSQLSKSKPSKIDTNKLIEKLGSESDMAETEDDLPIIDPSILGQAVVFGTDWTAATLIDQLKKGNIKLDPIFQRRDAWNDQRKSRFIESIVLGLPIPQIVLAEDKDDRGSFLVIDGKQRLLSLQRFAGIGLDPADSPLTLKGLQLRSELNNKSYEDLQNDTRLRNQLNAFDNQPIRTVVVKNWQKEDVLYLIFHRLNSETLPLSPQELRQALHPGNFLKFAAEYTAKVGAIHRALGIDKPDFRMRDVELFVRYFAFQYAISDYAGNLKEFLDNECKQLNMAWSKKEDEIRTKAQEMEESIIAVEEIFGSDAFRKWDAGKQGYEARFNRAIFDIMVYYFVQPSIRKKAVSQRIKVKSSFQELSSDISFLRSLETTTKSVEATSTRFKAWGEKLAQTLKLEIDIPDFKIKNKTK